MIISVGNFFSHFTFSPTWDKCRKWVGDSAWVGFRQPSLYVKVAPLTSSSIRGGQG